MTCYIESRCQSYGQVYVANQQEWTQTRDEAFQLSTSFLGGGHLY